MRRFFLPFHSPYIEKEEINEVVDTLKSGWITTGPKSKRFEENFRTYIGSKHAIAVNSCTAGLHLALITSGIKNGDEVITTPYTFASTSEVIIQVGAKPIFVDIDKKTFNIDCAGIERAITDKTKAIIPVHFAGHPCEMDKIIKIAKKYNLAVIEDAAHAIAARYKNRAIGTIGNISVFSFYSTKNITTGEGGMITTDNDEYAEKMRILSLHGISKDAWKRYSSRGSWYYEILEAGYKYNMTDIQAAIGIHQLTKLDKFQSTREKYVRMYNEAFNGMPEIIIPHARDNVKHAWHLYVIQINPILLKIDRNHFIEELRQENIGTSVHFIPLHLHPYYQRIFGYKRGDFPNAEYVYDRVISLPLYPKMTEKDVLYVIKSVKKIAKEFKK